jgi:hypothetical protein
MEDLGHLGGFFGFGDLLVAEMGGFIHGSLGKRISREFYQCAGWRGFGAGAPVS